MMEHVCPMCHRPLGDVHVQQHHLMPKMYGGRQTIAIHKMCHQKIHATFTEAELRTYYHTVDRLLEHHEIQKFVKWIGKKDPSFYDKNDDTHHRKSRRKR